MLEKCYSEVDAQPFALVVHGHNGAVYGFPYGHLLHFDHARNPDTELQPHAPTERLVCTFSSHDLILLGWHMKPLVQLLGSGRLATIHLRDARYRGLNPDTPFVCECTVGSLSKS